MPILLTHKPAHCSPVERSDGVLFPMTSPGCDFCRGQLKNRWVGNTVPALIRCSVLFAERWQPLEGRKHSPPRCGERASSGHVSRSR